MDKEKNNRTKIASIIILGVIVLFVLIAFFIYLYTSGSIFAEDENSFERIDIYYFNPQDAELVPEERKIYKNNRKDMVNDVLNEFVKEPTNANLEVIPMMTVKIKEVTISKDSLITIDFSDAYYDLSNTEELILRSALVWTLTDLSFIDKVDFKVDGVILTDKTGDPIGTSKRENTIIHRPEVNPTAEIRTLSLYFSNKEGTGLLREERDVEINPTSSTFLERSMIKELIKGPAAENSIKTIPQETKIYDINVTEGICYLDLNKDFVEKFDGPASQEVLMIQSIVNTLSSSPNVQKVQFLVEGDKISDTLSNFQEIDLSKPIEKDEFLVINPAEETED